MHTYKAHTRVHTRMHAQSLSLSLSLSLAHSLSCSHSLFPPRFLFLSLFSAFSSVLFFFTPLLFSCLCSFFPFPFGSFHLPFPTPHLHPISPKYFHCLIACFLFSFLVFFFSCPSNQITPSLVALAQGYTADFSNAVRTRQREGEGGRERLF